MQGHYRTAEFQRIPRRVHRQRNSLRQVCSNRIALRPITFRREQRDIFAMAFFRESRADTVRKSRYFDPGARNNAGRFEWLAFHDSGKIGIANTFKSLERDRSFLQIYRALWVARP